MEDAIKKPELLDESGKVVLWHPTPEQEFFQWVNGPSGFYVRAKYEEFFGLDKGTTFPIFDIERTHYKNVMTDVVAHMNYFLAFYDLKHDLFTAIMSIKFIIDHKPKLKPSTVRRLIMERIVTDEFLDHIAEMTHDLYDLNIDNAGGTSYANTPKITNEQATQLVLLSFCYRMVLCLCLHFVHNNSHFKALKDYIPFMDKLYIMILNKVEKYFGIEFYFSLCRFIDYRCYRQYNANRGTWAQKKQLYGSTLELYTEEIVHEVILVKSLHKLKYNRSVVSFIDGVLFKYSSNFRRENYKSKPYELDSTEVNSDGDDYLSHAEAIEMANYQIDESNSIISDVNIRQTMELLKKKFPFPISKQEYDFYYKNCKVNAITQMLLVRFYSTYFGSVDSIYSVPLADTITLMIIAKKFFQLKGLDILPQLFTANIQGKYKDNAIKKKKFIDEIQSTDTWTNILLPRYRYVIELEGSAESIMYPFSLILNSTFTLVDYESPLNDISCTDLDPEVIKKEVLDFLSIT